MGVVAAAISIEVVCVSVCVCMVTKNTYIDDLIVYLRETYN